MIVAWLLVWLICGAPSFRHNASWAIALGVCLLIDLLERKKKSA